ncbi:hypothetical protein EC100833_3321, partial [Escherichia coli 10.0833]
RQR